MSEPTHECTPNPQHCWVCSMVKLYKENPEAYARKVKALCDKPMRFHCPPAEGTAAYYTWDKPATLPTKPVSD